jgi:hypothetical protein
MAAGVTWVVSVFTVYETSYYNRNVDAPLDSYEQKKSFIQQLGVTSGYNKDMSFFRVLCNTVAVIGYPPVMWTGLTNGVFVGW